MGGQEDFGRLCGGPRLLAILGALASTSCARETPSRDQVERVERALSQAPCVGDLGRWLRSYRYAAAPPRNQTVLRNVILFDLIRGPGVKPGRQVVAAQSYSVDGEGWKLSGSYRLSSSSLRVEGCTYDLPR
ncbi:hypothetical protein GCM10022281_08340 [Sphingomonas rosea]|uniref:Lipoprotein n=1 Tax=Sphingomonas rosea TaxID=335605 RepID=A0ABP7TUD2_9SPHN